MQPLPHRYTVTLQDGQLVSPTRPSIPLGAPPQFGGSDRVWSPEELLVGATLECLWTTFVAYARRDKLTIEEWTGTGTGTLERGPLVPVFTSIDLHVDLIVGADDVARAGQLLETAKRQCIVGNALNVPVTLHANVQGKTRRLAS